MTLTDYVLAGLFKVATIEIYETPHNYVCGEGLQALGLIAEPDNWWRSRIDELQEQSHNL